MRDEALGLVEVIGLLAAVEAADTGLKSANVSLIGIENATGAYLTVQFGGDVGAVRAAVDAAKINAEKVGQVVSIHIIPRPALAIRTRLLAEATKKVENADSAQAEPESTGSGEPEPMAPESGEQEQEEPAGETMVPEKESESQGADFITDGYTCNLCKDPKCPREKGQPAKLCIHSDEK